MFLDTAPAAFPASADDASDASMQVAVDALIAAALITGAPLAPLLAAPDAASLQHQLARLLTQALGEPDLHHPLFPVMEGVRSGVLLDPGYARDLLAMLRLRAGAAR